jgi:YidC/Oxa1 family membrane protein insertase
MERRVLLAISLSFAVLFLYQALFLPAPPQNASPLTPVSAPPAPSSAGGISASTPGNASASVPAAPVAVAPAPVVGDTEERLIVVETDAVRATFTNRGGRLRHWQLKNYTDDQEGPVDLVPTVIPPDLPLPFSLRVDDAATTALLNDSLYRVSGPNPGAERLVTFDLETPTGLRVRKTFILDPQSFIVTFNADVQQSGQALNPTVQWGPGMTDDIARTPAGSFLSPAFIYKAQAIYYADGDVEREAASALAGGAVREGQYRWGGVDDHYYISAVLQPPAPVRFEYQPVMISAPADAVEGESPTGEYISYSVRFPAPPGDVRFYIGPKQLDVMRAIDPEFTRAIYFGMFAWLAAPLLDALRWVHGYVGSWGWSIIVLTILINLVMFPLRHKSVVSMRRMQEIQPQMKAIQERYAKYKITDPERQKMNSEVMELYRAKGVNPASGCVPMLLTLPFLFAFYAMLGQAIEIKGESFWWIPDLALRDPLFVTPALMGLSMFWQQKITPTTADPTQQKIMMFMPVMITVTMLFAPSGLVIYWFVSNVWSIGQQYLTNMLIGPPKAAGAKPAKNGKPLKGAPADIVVPPTRGKK